MDSLCFIQTAMVHISDNVGNNHMRNTQKY